MCGRYVLTDLEKFLQRQPWIKRADEGPVLPRYNIAPMQDLFGVVRHKEEPGTALVKSFRWGLVPSWAKDESVGSRMINARAETLLEKPAFARALARRRCLIPADGFYEWKKPEGRRGAKQPYAIRQKDDRPLAFAGLWEVWHAPGDGNVPPLFTASIVTGPPNALVAPMHDRMPVILPESAYQDWIDVDHQDAEAAAALLKPFPAEQMYAYPVDQRVGNVGNDDVDLLVPLALEEPPPPASGAQQDLF